MFIIKGDIKEEIYDKNLKLINYNYYSTFDKSYINDNIGYHKIKNTNQYTFSFHIYNPRNHITKYFN